MNVHQYWTIGKDNFRVQQRTAIIKRVPSEIGVKLINILPEDLKQVNDPKQLKARIRHLFMLRVFYSVNEFVINRWGRVKTNPINPLVLMYGMKACKRRGLNWMNKSIRDDANRERKSWDSICCHLRVPLHVTSLVGKATGIVTCFKLGAE
ncbi:hypothetical protein J6590_092011 [Homalodisca vitripennis]|nr:hypothetical protein J6590_092011 [Homalodisca vitripennis]